MVDVKVLEEEFGEKVWELTRTWLTWLDCNTQALSRSSPFEIRSIYAEKCEQLISKRNKLVKEIDAIFESKCKQNKK